MTVSFANFTNKSPSWSMLDLAQAYMDSAKVLSEETEQRIDSRHGGVYSLLPIVTLLHQGLENFLKGASLRLDEKSIPRRTHDLKSLLGDYAKRIAIGSFPSDLLFEDDLIEWVSWWDQETADKTGPSEGTRFLHGKTYSRSYPGLTIDENRLAEIVKSCKAECVRVHLRLIQEFIPANPLHIVHPLQPWWESEESFEERVNQRRAELGIVKSVRLRHKQGGGTEVVSVWKKEHS